MFQAIKRVILETLFQVKMGGGTKLKLNSAHILNEILSRLNDLFHKIPNKLLNDWGPGSPVHSPACHSNKKFS